MKSLNSDKVELLNDYFADIGEGFPKYFTERVNENDNSYISRITSACKEVQMDEKLLNQQINTLKMLIELLRTQNNRFISCSRINKGY